MLATALVSIFAFALLMGLMALGVILSGKRLAGSCGGDPDSAHCGCSPEKKAVCRAKRSATSEDDDDDLDVFSGPPLSEDNLAPPGERRLIQLRSGRGE